MAEPTDIKREAEKKAAKEKEAHSKTVSIENMTWKDRYNFFVENITVEPMLGCYIVSSVLASLATQNLHLEKACRVNLGYSKEICDALTERKTLNYSVEEEEVQQLVARMGVWTTMLQSVLTAVPIIFVGSWSDRWGKRKPCMLFPIVGEFMTVVGLMVCTFFFNELPMEVAGFIEGFFPAITGGWFTMFIGIYSYIADVTAVDVRTLRIAIVDMFTSLGVPVGLALSGILYKKIGFYGVYSISAVMYIIGFYYGYTSIKEPKKLDKPILPDQPCAFIRDFFDVRHVLDTFKTAFKKGENKRKKKVMLLMLVMIVVIGPLYGEISVSYLFTRYKFNWDEVDFSFYSSYSAITNLIGTSFSVGVFSHLLKFDDAIIGIYSSMSKILSSFVYGFATTSLVFYLGGIVEILNGTSFIAMRSMVSKLVPTDELGKINSLFGVCEALVPLLYGPMYNAIYDATIHVMPGAFYIIGGILTVPAVFIFAWMYVQSRREAKQTSKTDPEKRNSIVSDVIPNGGVKETQTGEPIDGTTLTGPRKNSKHENGIGEEMKSEIINQTLEVTLNEEKKVSDDYKNGINNTAFTIEEK